MTSPNPVTRSSSSRGRTRCSPRRSSASHARRATSSRATRCAEATPPGTRTPPLASLRLRIDHVEQQLSLPHRGRRVAVPDLVHELLRLAQLRALDRDVEILPAAAAEL